MSCSERTHTRKAAHRARTAFRASRRRRRRSRSGVAALEFALVLPFLMMILMGIIDYGFYFFLNSSAVNAAREGARAGARFGVTAADSAGAVDAAEAAATSFLAGANIGVGGGTNNATVNAEMNIPNLVVTVTINPFTPLTGFVPAALLPDRISYVSSMRWEI